MGGLAEYALVNVEPKQGCADLLPNGVSSQGGAALASSGIAAMCMAKHIRKGDRVLVLGAGGGVGSHFVQLARKQGAAVIVGVGRDTKRLLVPPLSYDDAIDYTKKENEHNSCWTSIDKYVSNPFDVVVDYASGGWLDMVHASKKGQATGKKMKLVVKPASQGGRYLTSGMDTRWFDVNSTWAGWKLTMTFLCRYFKSRVLTRHRLPTYSLVMGLPTGRQPMADILQAVADGAVIPCIDPASPFPFTTKGVRAAMKLQESCHVRGKTTIVIPSRRTDL
jgi:NADPH:quinone reductase-like Zn-dependent oxidoreductase